MPVSFTRVGFIELWEGNVKISQHTQEREAVEKALNLADASETEVTFELRFPKVLMKKSPHVKSPGSQGDITPPATPSGLSAVAYGASQINLSWTANSDDTTSYVIRRSLTSNIGLDGADIVTKVGRATASHSDTGLSASTLYYYNIRAADAAGNNSPVSSSVTAATNAVNLAPVFIGSTTATPAKDYFYTLYMSNIWNDPESQPMTYTGSGTLPTGLSFLQTPARIEGTPTVLAQSTSYTVQANDGTNTTSQAISFTVGPAIVPTNYPPYWSDPYGDNVTIPQGQSKTFTATDAEGDEITFSWDPLLLPTGITITEGTQVGTVRDLVIAVAAETVPSSYTVRIGLDTASTSAITWTPQATQGTIRNVPSQYATIQAAHDAASSGDTILIASGTYTNAETNISKALLIQGNGTRPILDATGQTIANGKALFNVTVGGVVIENLEFRGAGTTGDNLAGIRGDHASGAVTVRQCKFYDCSLAMLTGNGATASVVMEHCEIDYCSSVNNLLNHQVYIGELASFAMRYCVSTRPRSTGHHVKSRARAATIEYNRIDSGQTSVSSCELEFPQGGVNVVRGNVLVKGQGADSDISINASSGGGDGAQWPTSSLHCSFNTFYSWVTGFVQSFVSGGSLVGAVTNNNVFITSNGLGTNISGGYTGAAPVVDASHTGYCVNAAAGDYRLQTAAAGFGSVSLASGITAPTANPPTSAGIGTATTRSASANQGAYEERA